MAWGARPDFRDSNHRTAIQFALPHLTILCLLEDSLRDRRWYECQVSLVVFLSLVMASSQHLPILQSIARSKVKNPKPLLPLAAASLLDPNGDGLPDPRLLTDQAVTRSTNTLIRAINTTKTWLVYHTLFPPTVYEPNKINAYRNILVNRPDSSGWSPIHYCAAHENPSIEILDALYCAGADMSLFTDQEHYTPLHCLAKCAVSSAEEPSDGGSHVYQFAVHLIRDLRAPLSACDKRNETCLHIAAERGESLDVLLAFLDCDITGAVQEMRNDRGWVHSIAVIKVGSV